MSRGENAFLVDRLLLGEPHGVTCGVPFRRPLQCACVSSDFTVSRTNRTLLVLIHIRANISNMHSGTDRCYMYVLAAVVDPLLLVPYSQLQVGLMIIIIKKLVR